MTTLSGDQLDRLNQAILRLYEPASFASLATTLFSAARLMVGFDVAGFAITDPANRTGNGVLDVPMGDITVDQQSIADFFAIPGVADGSYFALSRPTSMLDFQSEAQFKSTFFYQSFYRPLGALHDLTTNFDGMSGPTLNQLSLVRSHSPYDAQERLMLALFQPHMRQRYRQLLAAEPDHPHYATGKPLVRQDWILCSHAGAIIRHGDTVPARFAELRLPLGSSIPATWLEWLGRQLAPVDLLAPRGPLVVMTRHLRLIVHCLANPDSGENRLILLSAPPTHEPLTGREQEIGYWLRCGKTNAEIADILAISSATVKNHLARIFEKLGVENRTAAARYLTLPPHAGV